MCVVGFLSFLVLAIGVGWADAARLPALVLLAAAGAGALALGHCCGRHNLRWMDTPAIELVDRQVLRQFVCGFWGVTVLAMLVELLLGVLGVLFAMLFLRWDVSTAAEAATQSNAKHDISFSAVMALFFMAFVVAAGTEELGKAWAVRYPQGHKCCGGRFQSQATTDGALLPPPPPRMSAGGATSSAAAPSASATASATPSGTATTLAPQAQRLPTKTLVLQPAPHVPRVTIALFVAVAAGFSTSENLGYVFGGVQTAPQQSVPRQSPEGAFIGGSAVFGAPLHRVMQPWWRGALQQQLQRQLAPLPPPTPRRAQEGGAGDAVGQASDGAQDVWGLLLFALLRASLSLPLHVLCALLTAFAYIELDVAAAAGVQLGKGAWLKGLAQGVGAHGLFDFVLMLLGFVLPGRVGDTAVEIVTTVAAAAMLLGTAAWTYVRWSRHVKPLVVAYEAPLGVVAGQGGYAQLSTAGAPNGGDEDEGGIELTDA